MENFLLSKPSITHLANLILTALITFQLLRGKHKSRSTVYLVLSLMALSAIFFNFFIQYSGAGRFAYWIAYTIVPISMLSAIGHLQFAYHFPRNIFPRESRALGVIAGVILIIMVYRSFYSILTLTLATETEYFIDSMIILFFFSWVEIILIRKTIILAENRDTALQTYLADPRRANAPRGLKYWMAAIQTAFQKFCFTVGQPARAVRAFALLLMLGTLSPFCVLLESAGWFTGEASIHFRDIILLLYLFGFVWVYLERGPEPSSFSTRLIAVTLTAMLLVLSRVSYFTLSAFEKDFYNNRVNSLEFLRDAVGKTDFINLPEDILYINHYRLGSDGENPSCTTLFSRPLRFDQAGYSEEFYSEYITKTFSGELLTALRQNPAQNPETVKMQQINRTTLQIYLALTHQYPIASGYAMMPDLLKNSVFYTTSGDGLLCVVYNYRPYRQYIHRYAFLMAGLILLSTVLILLVFPLYFRSSLIRPLEALLEGVKEVNAGNYDTEVPIKSADEIGYLANSFNNMVRSIAEAKQQLQNYAAELEIKVDERTRDLKQKNEELQNTLAELEKTLRELGETQNQLLMKEKMAALGNLVAGVAHEINNPIGVINSAADVSVRCIQKIELSVESSISLEDLKKNQPFSKSLKILKTNHTATEVAGERIAKIVKSLKNFARLDEAVYQRVDVHEGLESTLTLLEHALRDRIAIEKHYGDLPKIFCAPNRLNQVFMNVLQNAIQAIEGNGKITIRTSANQQFVQVGIADSGRGIPPEILENVFDITFRAGSDRMKMGTGLSTSYRIIQEHRGEIQIESEVGKGTAVKITLPVG